MPVHDVVIVGAGPAGCAAALQGRRLGLEIRLLERSGAAGGLLINAWRIENYPGLPPMPGRAFAARLQADLARAAIEITPGSVSGVKPDPAGFAVLGDQGRLRTRCVILAVGTVARRLPVPGAEQLADRRLFYEVAPLRQRFPQAQHVVVIGGGEAAVDSALSLAQSGTRVTLALRGAAARARGWLARAAAAEARITIRAGLAIQGLRAEADGIALVACAGESPVHLAATAVLAAIGRRPATGGILPAPDWKPAGLFLVGDARRGRLGQAGMAVGDGLAAAMEAAELLEGAAE